MIGVNILSPAGDAAWFENDAFNSIDESSVVTVTADNAAHAKGAWSELIASTTANADMLWVNVEGIFTNATDTSTLIDFALGASGIESAFVSDIAVGGAASAGAAANGGITFVLPIKIPSGSRISARIQSIVTGGKTASVNIKSYDMGSYNSAPVSLDALGSSTATSSGTGMSANDTYTEVVSSTSQSYRGIVFVNSVSGTATASTNVNATVGLGAAGSEQKIGELRFRTTTSETTNSQLAQPIIFGKNIALGSRLAVKMASIPGTTTNYRSCLIGIP
jgi:hypothetical protein